MRQEARLLPGHWLLLCSAVRVILRHVLHGRWRHARHGRVRAFDQADFAPEVGEHDAQSEGIAVGSLDSVCG
jgi:hypothetical protein